MNSYSLICQVGSADQIYLSNDGEIICNGTLHLVDVANSSLTPDQVGSLMGATLLLLTLAFILKQIMKAIT